MENATVSKNTKKNSLECNKRARAKYINNHYKTIIINFKHREANIIEEYCNKNNITKNNLIYTLVMNKISN